MVGVVGFDILVFVIFGFCLGDGGGGGGGSCNGCGGVVSSSIVWIVLVSNCSLFFLQVLCLYMRLRFVNNNPQSGHSTILSKSVFFLSFFIGS